MVNYYSIYLTNIGQRYQTFYHGNLLPLPMSYNCITQNNGITMECW